MSNKHAYLSLILILVLVGSGLGQDEPPTFPYATNPSPADGAVDVPLLNTVLSWTPAENAVYNRVYFGTDPENLKLRSILRGNSFNCGQLKSKTTYYWKILTEYASGRVAPQAEVWSFLRAINLLFLRMGGLLEKILKHQLLKVQHN